MKKNLLKVFLTMTCMLSITACNKSDNTTKETKQEIVMQESTTADLTVNPESSFQEPEITMGEGMQSGDQQLSDKLKAHITVGNTDFHFEENQYLAINGRLFGVRGLALFDEKMELYTFIYDIEFVNVLDIRMVDITKPLILANDKEWGTDVYVIRNMDKKRGVYVIKDKEWKIKPFYNSIHVKNDGTYRTYANGKTTELDLQGNIILRPSELRLGDRIWEVAEPMRGAKIYDQSGQLINHFTITGDADYTYQVGDFFKVVYSPENAVLYDKDGEIVFSKQDIPKDVVTKLDLEGGLDRPLSIVSICDDGSLIEFEYNEVAMIFDLKNRILLTQPEDRAHINKRDSVISYTVYNDEGIVVYHQDGTPVMSQMNIPYFMVVGNGCYAYKDGDFLVIDDTKSQETCRIKLETEIYSAEQVLSGMYLLEMDNGKSYLYQGDQLVETSDDIYYTKYFNDDRIAVVCCDYAGDGSKLVGSYVFDQNGNLLYQSKSHASYYLITDQFLVYAEQQYIYVVDYNGNMAMTLEQ